MLSRIRALPNFSATTLQIVKKLGGLTHLKYKPLQNQIHAEVEWQLTERGWVRIVVVKPRQIRASTYFKSLEFEEMYNLEGSQSLTVTHRSAVTNELFATLKRFQDYMPPELKLKAKKDNEEILYLSNESKAIVTTAGSDAARGFPCRILDIEELGRFTGRQVKDVQDGAMQTLGAGEGSVGIINSTSGGSGTYFHDIAKAGREKNARWRTIFFGWHEEPEYRLELPHPDWEPTPEDKDLAKNFKEHGIADLDLNQLYWRADKIETEFAGSVSAFNQEYPATFDMAFEEAGGRLMKAIAIHKARMSDIEPLAQAPAILGVDPAGSSNTADRTAMVLRKGNAIPRYWTFRNTDEAALVGIINDIMNEYMVHTCFIDMGYGHTIVSLLNKLGRYNVIGIHFGSTATKPLIYGNMRTEMADKFKKWIEEGPESNGGYVSIPGDKEFADDLKIIPELQFIGSKGKLWLPSKDEIKKELHKSPDIFDAGCLTFAHEVTSNAEFQLIHQPSFEETRVVLETSRIFSQLQQGDKQDRINPNFKNFSIGPNKTRQ